jgi:hypothetical protein
MTIINTKRNTCKKKSLKYAQTISAAKVSG